MTRPARTLERLERLLRVVPWLLVHPGAPVDEVAERFGIDREELLADLDLLGFCGIPGYGGGDLVEVRVVDDRITVWMADDLRDPLRLTAPEALVLLLAARTVAALGDLAPPALSRAADRLAEALDADDAVAVDVSAAGHERLPAALQAVESRRVARLRYRDSLGEITERDVEPWAVSAARGAWYLQAYCRQAQGPRDFRLDRALDLTVSDEPAPEPPADLPAPGYRPGDDDPWVTLEADGQAASLLTELPGAVVESSPQGVRVTAPVARLDWAARLVLSGAGRIRPVAPSDLVDEVARLASAAAAARQEVPQPSRKAPGSG